jgi:hypothetical protein
VAQSSSTSCSSTVGSNVTGLRVDAPSAGTAAAGGVAGRRRSRAAESGRRWRGLTSTPSMPAPRQARRSASELEAVMAMTDGGTVPLRHERNRRVASLPSMPGRWTSMSTTSNRVPRAISTAVAPLAATTAWCPSRSSITTAMSRHVASSSTTSTRRPAGPDPVTGVARPDGAGPPGQRSPGPRCRWGIGRRPRRPGAGPAGGMWPGSGSGSAPRLGRRPA